MPVARKILLGVSGGIAAYKSPDLVRRLRERGAEVRVVMTDGAQRFITPLTLQAVSGWPVRTDLWDEHAESAMGHNSVEATLLPHFAWRSNHGHVPSKT